MKSKLLTSFTIVAPLLMLGCQAPSESALVSVRFVMPPAPQRFADSYAASEAHLVMDSSHEDFNQQSIADDGASSPFDRYHVALWGGQFQGNDVTYMDAPLNPGNYTFGFWDQDHAAAFQGWINVNTTGDGLVDTLRKWKQAIPRQKEWIAYDYEVNGKLNNEDSGVFKSFAKQLRAFDRLDRQIDMVIHHEMRAQEKARKRNNDFLKQSTVLVLPEGGGVFHPTTQPTFTMDEVSRVQSGTPVSKLVMVADSQDNTQKLLMVNKVYRELLSCKAVMVEEVDRLERRKRFYTITDHIYNHDRKFVENEMRLQQTLSTIDELNEEILDIRQRRLALAFTSELIAPDGLYHPLDDEERDMSQERIVLVAKKDRLDRLFNETDENSPKRIALERRRQRFARAIDAIDNQLNLLADARTALDKIRMASKVIQRQGDTRMLAATYVGSDIPFRVREAVERESLMSMRLEASNAIYAPDPAGMTRAQTASYKSMSKTTTTTTNP